MAWPTRLFWPEFAHRLLAKVQRGLPALSLECDATRRLWQFMEQLDEPSWDFDEITIKLLDPATKSQLAVTVDVESRQYLTISKGD